jgi:hypothetical protein
LLATNGISHFPSESNTIVRTTYIEGVRADVQPICHTLNQALFNSFISKQSSKNIRKEETHMKIRPLRLSREQLIHLFHTFLLISRDLFGGMIGMDGYCSIAGFSPVADSIREFIFVLEKDGMSGNIGMITRLGENDTFTADYYIVLPPGDLVYGEVEDLEKMEGKKPIYPRVDKSAASELLLKAASTKAGHLLSLRLEPSGERYSLMLSEMEKRFRDDSSEESQLMAVSLRHERILKDYTYEPGDGEMRDLNEDELLLIKYLFLVAAADSLDDPYRFRCISGDIFPDEKLVSRAYAVFIDTNTEKHHVGIIVDGPLNTAKQENICFACFVPEKKEVIFFDTITEALASEYSEIRDG